MWGIPGLVLRAPGQEFKIRAPDKFRILTHESIDDTGIMMVGCRFNQQIVKKLGLYGGKINKGLVGAFVGALQA